MSNTPTPHITAAPGDFAATVLMPGDPLRARFIAQNFLENARLVNDVRGVQGYTGRWRGKRVSVMASGMGMPSIGIYAYELFSFYGVENIIRIGSAGMIGQNLRVRDIVAAMSAYTNSSFGRQYGFDGNLAVGADPAPENIRSEVISGGNVIKLDRRGVADTTIGPTASIEPCKNPARSLAGSELVALYFPKRRRVDNPQCCSPAESCSRVRAPRTAP